LRHTEVEHVRLVEIDALVVEACRAHFAWTAAALDDPRVELTIGDGVAFVRETSEHFDVVLIDSTDPIGPAAPLFGADFYRDVRRILAEPGIVVAQAETPWYQARAQRALLETLRRRFRRIQLYNYSNLTYPGGLWSFAFASDDLHPVVDLDPTRLQRAGLACRYYNAAVHGAAFSLPEFVLQAVGDLIDRP
jgi:spermidine synthase